MGRSLEIARGKFFSAVCRNFPVAEPCRLLLVTHLLQDRPVLVDALSRYCSIEQILGIPYSVVPRIQSLLTRSFRLAVLPLKEMLNPQTMFDVAAASLERSDVPLAIMEIGGYFAGVGNKLHEKYGALFLGTVEDTENGQRHYEANQPLHFSVVSVARSPLKLVEDRLIGPSIVFSLERFLRSMGQTLVGCKVTVLGYGRIGSGLASALAGRGVGVTVFDTSSIRRALAVADGFPSTDREVVLANSDVIIGTTGEQSVSAADFNLLKDGAVLASGSSKQVEFDMKALEISAENTQVSEDVTRYNIRNGNVIYVLQDGTPINFRDGAVVGPSISLTQAELILALRALIQRRNQPGITDVDARDRENLAALWLDHFVDGQKSGAPILNIDFPV